MPLFSKDVDVKIYLRIYAYIRTDMHTWMYVMHICIYAYIHACIHTYRPLRCRDVCRVRGAAISMSEGLETTSSVPTAVNADTTNHDYDNFCERNIIKRQ